MHALLITSGVEIAYIDEGEGEPILLIHGFGSNHAVNWVGNRLGRAPDQARPARRRARQSRPWPVSTKLYDPADYHPPSWRPMRGAARPSAASSAAVVMGYSMGARIAAFLALERAASGSMRLILGGLGMQLVDGDGLPPTIGHGHGGGEPRRCRPTRWGACSAPSPTRAGPTGGRSPPAFAAPRQTSSGPRSGASCSRP